MKKLQNAVEIVHNNVRKILINSLKFTNLQPKLGLVSSFYQADCHLHYEIQFRKYTEKNGDQKNMNDYSKPGMTTK